MPARLPWSGAGRARCLARGACAAAVVLAACTTAPPPDENGYVARISRLRAEQDAAFRDSPSSPIPSERRSEFLPLTYFPPDPDFSAPAALRASTEQQVVEMPTSTGLRRSMQRVGTLEFTLKGQAVRLAAFVEAQVQDVDRLFIPFTDLTTGTETYEAGRYLDLNRSPTAIYVVDFNRAYNPYCYYNPTYDCPFPPRENRLAIAIRAGQRLPGGK